MTPRQGKAAAVAALIVGLRLTFDRSWMAPSLLPGTRGGEIRAANAAPRSQWGESSGGGSKTDDVGARPASYDDASIWRDAPADAAKFNGPPDGGESSSAFAATRSFGARALQTQRGPGPPAQRSASGSDTVDVLSAARAASSRAASSRRAAPRQEPSQTSSLIPKTSIPDGVAPHAQPPARQPRPEDSRSGRSAQAGPRAARGFPLFWPPSTSIGSARDAQAGRTIRPPLLSRLLGRGARRPPKASLSPPDLSSLNARRPQTLPDGGPVPGRPFELERIEETDPARAAGPSCRRRAPHWHAQNRWHDGAARGVVSDDHWMWLWREKGNWWADADPSPPLLRHQGLWWRKERGVWFAVHEGELWSWRRFSQWDAEGLLRLIDGVSIVYSSDFSRVAMITPGHGAVLYDAASGAELGRWREDQLPHRRPRPPSDLRLPRGI